MKFLLIVTPSDKPADIDKAVKFLEELGCPVKVVASKGAKVDGVISQVVCKRCGHKWYPLSPYTLPRHCTNCHSPNWNRDNVRPYTKKDLKVA